MKRKVNMCLVMFLFFCAVACGELRTVRKELDVGGIYTNWWIDAARDVGAKDGCTYWCLGPRGRYRPAWFGIIRRDTVWSGDGGLLYPGEISSEWGCEGGAGSCDEYWIGLRLHRIRDGIEDREYFWLMNDLAEKLRREGKLTNVLRQRIKKLNDMPSLVTFGMGNFIHNTERVNQIRRQIADVIVEIRKGQKR